MRLLLFLAFLVVPILEIWVLIQVGQVIGGWPTVALLLADSLFGAWIVRREGRRAWRSLQGALGQGRMPDRELADGAMIVAGGALLLTPGFLTDVAGFLLVLPFTRPLMRRLGSWFFARRIRALAKTGAGPGLGMPFGAAGLAGAPSAPSGPPARPGADGRTAPARSSTARSSTTTPPARSPATPAGTCPTADVPPHVSGCASQHVRPRARSARAEAGQAAQREPEQGLVDRPQQRPAEPPDRAERQVEVLLPDDAAALRAGAAPGRRRCRAPAVRCAGPPPSSAGPIGRSPWCPGSRAVPDR
nr:hypothetical protein GCM10020093_025540 [Planobispora longispora]